MHVILQGNKGDWIVCNNNDNANNANNDNNNNDDDDDDDNNNDSNSNNNSNKNNNNNNNNNDQYLIYVCRNPYTCIVYLPCSMQSGEKSGELKLASHATKPYHSI